MLSYTMVYDYVYIILYVRVWLSSVAIGNELALKHL